MASADSSSTELARSQILEHGFFYLKDSVFGKRRAQMEENSTHFASVQGLEFYKHNVLDEPRVLEVISAFFEWFGLGLYRTFGPIPGDYAYRRSNPESDVESLLVQVWCKGSKVTFWGASHKCLLPTIWGENDLWRTPRVAFRDNGLHPTPVSFDDGGISIRDTRVHVEIAEGNAITWAIGKREVVDKWKPMRLPKSLKETVEAMEGPKYGMNAMFY